MPGLLLAIESRIFLRRHSSSGGVWHHLVFQLVAFGEG